MKPIKFLAQIGLLLTIVVSSPFVAGAQTQTELALPSLSIFGFPLPPSAENEKFDHQYPAQELELFLAEVNKTKLEQSAVEPAKKKLAFSFIIPIVF